MIQFRLAAHSIRKGISVVEILLNGDVVATMTSGPEPGMVRIISNYMKSVERDDGKSTPFPIEAVEIVFDRPENNHVQ